MTTLYVHYDQPTRPERLHAAFLDVQTLIASRDLQELIEGIRLGYTKLSPERSLRDNYHLAHMAIHSLLGIQGISAASIIHAAFRDKPHHPLALSRQSCFTTLNHTDAIH